MLQSLHVKCGKPEKLAYFGFRMDTLKKCLAVKLSEYELRRARSLIRIKVAL
jgi:hypothetical protein